MIFYRPSINNGVIMWKPDGMRSYGLFLTLFLSLLTLAGCGGKVEQADLGPVFFPPLPNEPRIQFLKGISTAEDVTGKDESFGLITVVGEADERIDQIVKPYGVAAYKGKIYVCDTGAAQVLILDLVNKKFEKLKGNFSSGKLKKPINLDLDDEGKLYVTDTSRKEVVVYDQSGNFLKGFGATWDWKPIDVALSGKYLHVTDFKKHEVKVLNREDGKELAAIGSNAEELVDRLSIPLGLSVNKKGVIRVVNLTNGRVISLDRDGHVLGAFGNLGDGFGEFGRPKGIDVDEQDRLYVVDTAHQNIQMFTDKGRLLVFFGDPGLPKGSMNMPVAVAVTTDNLDYYQTLAAPGFILERVIIVTNQYGSEKTDKVAIYGLGAMKK
jgi:sugar lactone lactonase YvrE/predicted small lipoprotein YifL